MERKNLQEQEVEQKLQAYFQAEASKLQAPANLWARIEEGMAGASGTEGMPPVGPRGFFLRRLGLLPAFVTTLALLLAVSGAWLLTASPWQGAPTPLLLTDTKSDSAFRSTNAAGVFPMPAAPTPTPRPVTAPTPTRGGAGAATITVSPLPAPSVVLETAERQIISQASITVEVADVQAAITQVRTMAESMGGFVSQLNRSGPLESQQAILTIRVPQPQFLAAIERLEALGKVQGETLGSEDVSEQFIDLKARLQSAQREEESLLSLLGKATQVSELLTIERELARVRSEVERFQGQLNFLQRRVELATITVTLFPPETKIAEPPSASLTIEVSNVSSSLDAVKALVSQVRGELDGVFVSVKGGRERADLGFRVFTGDFDRVLTSVESQGKVLSEEVREGRAPTRVGGEGATSEKPEAVMQVSLVEKAPGSKGRIIAITAPVGGVALTALLGFLFYLAYRAGARRGSGA